MRVVVYYHTKEQHMENIYGFCYPENNNEEVLKELAKRLTEEGIEAYTFYLHGIPLIEEE